MSSLAIPLLLLAAGIVFWLPGLVVADAIGAPTRAARWLSALWLGPLFIGLWAVALSPLPLAPWLPALSMAVVVLWVGRSSVKADLKAGWDPDGPPVLLLALVALYGLLRPDTLAFNTLGVLGPAVEAAGYPLGIGRELPSTLLGRSLPAPLGQIAPAVAAIEVFGQAGVRILFSMVLMSLAGATFELARRLEAPRRLCTAAAAFAVFNPLVLAANHLDALANILPAVALGWVLTVRRKDFHPLWILVLVVVRPIVVVAVPFLGRKDPLRWLPVLLVPLAIGAMPLASGGAFQLDPGLLPIAGLPDAWVWTAPWTRLPYAAAPAWVGLPLWLTAGVGSAAIGAAWVGLSRWTDRSLLFRLVLPVAGFLLLTNLALQAEHASRLAIFLVPLVVLAALGIDRMRTDCRALVIALAITLGLPLVARGLVAVPWPEQSGAYERFAHLQPEPEAWLAQERRRAAAAMPWPSYSVEHLIDPWFIGGFKRWRDLAHEFAHPSLTWRYLSIDETILSFTKGERFTARWMPDHARHRPRGQERGPGDPYLEEESLVVGVDLGTALADGRLRAECRRDDALEVHIDLASQTGPLAATVRIPGQADVSLAAFKEYYGPTDVETALVISPPTWGAGPEGPTLTLPDGVLRVRVPGRAFLSYAQLLGEREHTLELLVGQVFHAALRCDEGVEVFGPFRQ